MNRKEKTRGGKAGSLEAITSGHERRSRCSPGGSGAAPSRRAASSGRTALSGSTANDALWAGLPVLICAGDSYVGRMAGSMLHAIGLPELVTTSLAEYEGRALKLAREPARLAQLRHQLADNRARMPLFDMAPYTRDLEAAYARMWQCWRDGQTGAR